MMACTQHVSFQLPIEFTRAGYLLDGIENFDSQFQAVIVRVLDDTGAGGKRNNFELCAAYILPKDPVVRRRSTQEKRKAAEISSNNVRYAGPGNGVGASNSNVSYKGAGKKGIGSTGVRLRYHKPEEYNKFTLGQRKELQEWRTSGKTTTGNKKARHDK